MKNTLKIYIPSRGRADKVTTLQALPPGLRESCTIVVRHDEANAYKAKPEFFGKVLVMPKGINGISATRQWIMENADERFHCQMDDDITGFCFKPKSLVFGGIRRIPADHRIGGAFKTLMDWISVEGIAHVGIAERSMAARPGKKPYYENNRLGQLTMWDLRVMRKLGARFDRVKLMQDLDMNLQFLRAGYPSRVLTKISYVAKPEDYAGGCSIFRNDDLKRKMCDKMARLHKGLVESKEKVKFGRTYYHLRTSWRKALGADT